jgi:RNA polymerase sigma-70 factor (ECF subfamily)
MDRDQRFKEVYAEHYGAVYRYCYRRLSSDDVADVTDEVFVVAWRRLDEMPSGADSLPWLYRVARNLISNAHRGERRRLRLRAHVQSLPVEVEHSPEDLLANREEGNLARRALAALRESDREVIRLAVWEELSIRQLAASLGVSENAAAVRLSRARRKLEAAYRRLEPDS